MIKDLIVNLSTAADDNTAATYAISLAREFDAHLAAVAFAYEAVPLAMLGDDMAAEIIDELMNEAEAGAKAAVSRFEEATRGSGVLKRGALDDGQFCRNWRRVRPHRAPV